MKRFNSTIRSLLILILWILAITAAMILTIWFLLVSLYRIVLSRSVILKMIIQNTLRNYRYIRSVAMRVVRDSWSTTALPASAAKARTAAASRKLVP